MAGSRLQVDLGRETLSVLDTLMVAVRDAEANRKIGAGTVAARLLETLAAHPDIIEQLLSEYSSRVVSGVSAESRAEYKVKRPFAGAGGKQGKAKK